MMKLNVAIIGFGFVGGAVDYGFPESRCNKTIIDPKQGTSIEDLKEKTIDVSFICVPTPMGDDARIDASILEDAVEEALTFTSGLVVIKSTVIPSIAKRLGDLSDRVVYNPEFLTERNAKNDFVNPPMHVLGGTKESTDWLLTMYSEFSSCAPCEVFHVTVEEASFIKYGMNSFLMSKVVWFNQFYDVVEQTGCDYNSIISAMKADPRIGSSHMNVPGYDGRKGAAGACFAKDGPAFARYAQDQAQDFTILEQIIRVNQHIRNSYGEPLPREIEQKITFNYEI